MPRAIAVAMSDALADAAVDAVVFGIPGLSAAESPEQRELAVQEWLFQRAERVRYE